MDCNGNSCYLKYDVYGETSEVKLFSKRTGDELVYIETSTERNITNYWIDKFEQFHYDESAFLAFLKATIKEPEEVFY